MTKPIEYDHALAQAIVDTIREPLLVLDEDLRVVAASRSFYSTFKVNPQDTDGRLLDALGDGQWDISVLCDLLKRISPDQTVLEGYEVDLDFPHIGRRVMLLNARKVFYEARGHATILVAFEDITAWRATERQRDQLMRDKDLLLQEMQHRVANSLQIIASILLLKARNVTSEETRGHLHDAHKRVLAVASVQQHLHATGGAESINLPTYLTQLCESLAASMIGEDRKVAVIVRVPEGNATSSDAVSIGLIVTELVINALKHAFPVEKLGNTITVRYETTAPDWRLTVTDNGVGKRNDDAPKAKSGLGTSIVAALADQLQSRVDIIASDAGTSVSITHAEYSAIPRAA